MSLERYLIDEEEAVMVVNSFVDEPAHGRKFIAFKSQDKKQMLFLNEEKRMVTGVVIEANKPIYRRDGDYEYEVVFTPKAIENLAKSLFREGKHNLIDINHDGIVMNNAVYLVESFFKSETKHGGFDYVADGSWIATYKVESDELWGMIKRGEINGFSVFINANINKSKMKKDEKFLNKIFSDIKRLVGIGFAEVKTIDGIVLSYEGELKEGVQLSVVTADGSTTPANPGEYVIEVDGVQKVLVIGDGGVLMAIRDVATAEPALSEMQQMAEVLKAAVEKFNQEIEALKNEINALKESKTERFKKADEPENKGKSSNSSLFRLN